MQHIFRSTTLVTIILSCFFSYQLCAMHRQEPRTTMLAELDGNLSIAIKKHDTAMIESYLTEVNTLAKPEQPLSLDLSFSSAAFSGDTTLVEKFLNIPGFKLKDRDITSAIKQNRADLIQAFVEHGLDLRNPLPNSLITEDLRKALKEKRLDVVQRYRNRDIPVQVDTPLTYAARLKSDNVLRYLTLLSYNNEELDKASSLFSQKTIYIDADDIDSDDEDDTSIENKANPSKKSDVFYIQVNGITVATGSTIPTHGESHPLPSASDKPQAQPSFFTLPQTQPFASASPETEDTSYPAWGTSVAAASIIAAGAVSAVFLQWLYNKIKQRLPKKKVAA